MLWFQIKIGLILSHQACYGVSVLGGGETEPGIVAEPMKVIWFSFMISSMRCLMVLIETFLNGLLFGDWTGEELIYLYDLFLRRTCFNLVTGDRICRGCDELQL